MEKERWEGSKEVRVGKRRGGFSKLERVEELGLKS